MLSRAHLLIQRDYEDLQKEAPWGIEGQPLGEDSIFEWTAKIKGLPDTIWEGGVFRIYMKFDEYYKKKPPDVCFHTIPFHPNVDMITGKPGINFLDDFSQWKETYSISYILKYIQDMLSNPNFSRPINPDAADMIIHSPNSYKQIVLDCVATSQKVEAGIINHQIIQADSRVRFAPKPEETIYYVAPPSRGAPCHISKLSFEDYHKTWAGIATSKAGVNDKNAFLEGMKDNSALQKTHIGLPVQEIEDQMKRQIVEHNALMYGRFKEKPDEDKQKEQKLAKLNKMKKIYLPPRTPIHSEAPQGSREEPWEKEVDDLVAWTSKLDAESIDA